MSTPPGTESFTNAVEDMQEVCPRAEHPNPQFYRPSYLILNGTWEFDFDDENRGIREKWHMNHSFQRRIVVPFAFQSTLSGIGDTSMHDIVWYHRTFHVPKEFSEKRILLHFGAVDYAATVWVNGEIAAVHEGGHSPFCADITPLLLPDGNTITVRVYDDSRDLALPRGKQYWKEQSASIFYTRTTGIWQTVWLEAVPDISLGKVRVVPLLDAGAIDMEVYIDGWSQLAGRQAELETSIRFEGKLITQHRLALASESVQTRVGLHPTEDQPLHRWNPDHPHLYDITYTLLIDGCPTDSVESYFGLRKISVESGKFLLNNYPYRMRMVLDQGYFPDGNLTPPSDDAIRRDIELTKAMGFNGARKHQKIEDPRYLYWCDKLGLLVWGEMSNAYVFSELSVQRLVAEWQQAVLRDFNHPCIIAWVPVNESWGVPNLLTNVQQRSLLVSLYHLTKALDSTRLVISNDGWEQATTDLCTIHDYESRKDVLIKRYKDSETAVSATPAQRLIFAPGYEYSGQPILVTEMGGISYKKSEQDGWGYSVAGSEHDFIERYRAVIQAMYESPVIQGFCYTQLTDVEQETNGLLTYDRIPKAPLDIIRAITEGRDMPESD